ncbi:hypothetical protein A8135_08930 [Legionella jamestowniensis]|uniref:Uncharacterized protein n=1 Tax=Legionella jamestowniensis TaxID=455 RepID=A0ABX2XWA6_9GAMM|nr:hypothetical protein A8135_08930 [Legionella jamestowniensis]
MRQVDYKSFQKHSLGLPDDIQSHIASFLADYHKGICRFGSQGRIIYPPNMSQKQHESREVYEREVFSFFKSLSGKEPREKKDQFLFYQFTTPEAQRL